MMATDEAVGEAATPKANAAANFEKAARWWNWMVVSLPLLTVIGFFFTSVFLLVLFGKWGLSGIQLVAPQEVALPGFVTVYLVAAIVLLPFGLARFVSWFATEDVGRSIVRWIGGTLLTVSLIWCLVDPQWRLVAALLASSSGLLLVQIAMKAPSDTTVAKALFVLNAAGLAIGLALWLGAVGALINQIANVGWARGIFVTDKDAACMGKVLWLGERAIVIRCSVGSEEIRVMSPKEGLKFSTERELALASKYVAQ